MIDDPYLKCGLWQKFLPTQFFFVYENKNIHESESLMYKIDFKLTGYVMLFLTHLNN